METQHLGQLLRIDANRHAAFFEKAHTAKVADKQPKGERVSRFVLGGVSQLSLERAAVEVAVRNYSHSALMLGFIFFQ